jgi:hypothetical protein
MNLFPVCDDLKRRVNVLLIFPKRITGKKRPAEHPERHSPDIAVIEAANAILFMGRFAGP